MELIDYFRMLTRRWGWVLALTLVGLAAGVGWAVAAPKSYTASSDVFIGSVVPVREISSSAEAESASRYVLDRMPSYATLVSSPDVTTDVIGTLGLKTTPDDFAGTVTATVPPRTVIVRVSATADTATEAARISTATAEALGRTVEAIEGDSQGGNSPVSANVVRPATAAGAVASPNTKLAIALGLLVGLAAGLVVAALREQASRRPLMPGRRRRAAKDAENRSAPPPWIPPQQQEMTNR